MDEKSASHYNGQDVHDAPTTITAITMVNGSTDPAAERPTDSDDPLNWSWKKKHLVMVALASATLLSDWGITWGTPLFEAQALTWKISIPQAANSISGAIFMQGPGGLLAVPFAQRYGRLPVLFWSQFLSFVLVIGASLAPTYAGFTACRTLQGFFDTSPQVIGLSMIHDMFFFRERPRKINIWAFATLVGPFAGPFFSALLYEKLSWRSDFLVLAGLYGFSTVLVVVFGEETLYRPGEFQHSSPKSSKFARLVGIRGAYAVGRPSLWTVCKHCLSLSMLPQVFLPTAIFVCVDFMWAIGIITSVTQFVKPPPYLFTDLQVALLYLAPLIGVLLAQIWGHFFNDFLQDSYIRRHDGLHKPENRLWGVYPAVVLSIGGLILYGQTLQHQLLWIGLGVGWGMVTGGFMIATTAVDSYLLDSFPGHAALVSGWLNFWRTSGGFCVSYFQLKWVTHNGPAVTFGCQAATVAAAFVAIIATQIWGAKWRLKFPAPPAEN